jgi:hypothetical protein
VRQITQPTSIDIFSAQGGTQGPPLACAFPLENSKAHLKDRALAAFVSAQPTHFHPEPFRCTKIHRTVELSLREIAQQFVPGMLADVLIITGERAVLTYFLRPIIDRLAKAMRQS